ncbi:MAG: polysaccharide deacetylase family protein [bacterium]|nr:polysaccharide deacetylase family protein [bacterium]
MRFKNNLTKTFPTRPHKNHKKRNHKKVPTRATQQSSQELRPRTASALATFCIINAACMSFLTQNAFYNRPPYIPSSDQAAYAEISTTSAQTSTPLDQFADKLDLPILVYHIVRPSYPDDSASVRAIALTPETFDAQMTYLKESGYHVVTFTDLEYYYKNKKPLSRNPIILSFDDGWKDQFQYAFPILKKHGYTATFFVFTNSIDHKSFFSLAQLKEMLAAGMIIGSHSRTHPYLTQITNQDALWREISGSKKILEDLLGVRIHEFAYPFGAYNDTIVAMAKKAGYRSARGDYFTGVQSANHLYELSAMNAPTTMDLFRKKFQPK